MMELSETRKQELLNQYHEFKARLSAADEQEAARKEAQAREAAWRQINENLPERKSRTEQSCHLCGAVIPAYTKRKVATKPVNARGDWAWRTVHYCNRCRPLKTEVKQ